MCCAALFLTAAICLAAEPALEFVHLTDTHFAALDGVAPELALERLRFDEAGTRLSPFLEALSAKESGPYRPAFFLITGDLVDAFRFAGEDGRPVGGQIEAFRTAIGKSAVPVYLALGNHDLLQLRLSDGRAAPDLSAAGEARSVWMAAEPCFRNGTFYSFEKRAGTAAYTFLVLDNSGEMTKEQLGWLSREARKQPGRLFILAMHEPLGDDPSSMSIRSALKPARIALVLSGHIHRSGIWPIELGAGKAVQVCTAAFGHGEANWRRIRLYPDRIEVYVTGKPDLVDTTVRVGNPAQTLSGTTKGARYLRVK